MMMKPLDFERISVEDAAKSIDKLVRPGKVKDWDGDRPQPPAEKLSDFTLAWLASLPPAVHPTELTRRYPRIANTLGVLWKRPAQCDGYLKNLIIDERGGRKGFPPEVAQELSNLAGYYATVYPYRHSIWDDVMKK